MAERTIDKPEAVPLILLTRREAAALLGTTGPAVSWLTNMGRLRLAAMSLSGERFYSPAAIEELRQRRRARDEKKGEAISHAS